MAESLSESGELLELWILSEEIELGVVVDLGLGVFLEGGFCMGVVVPLVWTDLAMVGLLVF